MTAMMRQNHKQTLTMFACLAAILMARPLAWANGLPPDPTTARGPGIVTDALTGVALNGLDPVSYFTDPAPLPGRPDYEFDWQGAPWYFANAANRDAFIKAPAVYAPQFGGHATMALARGYLSDGNPQIFIIAAKRLYLFYSLANRDAFIAAPVDAVTAARKYWATLVPAPPPAPETAAADSMMDPAAAAMAPAQPAPPSHPSP
jgi:YHS domain-containing protein